MFYGRQFALRSGLAVVFVDDDSSRLIGSVANRAGALVFCINMLVQRLAHVALALSLSIYIIDYFRKNFLFVSDNPLFLCGHSADEVLRQPIAPMEADGMSCVYQM